MKVSVSRGLFHWMRMWSRAFVGRIGGRIHAKHVFWGVVFAVGLSFLWSTVAGRHGVFSYAQLKKDLDRLKLENRALLEEVHALEKDIHQLRNDPSCLERVIREEYGYITNGEKVYVLSEPVPVQKDREP